ncbi:phospholipid-translocating ATPase [Angomonas deanei]|uniref:Cation transport ATPase (P-type)/Phospholipid-translocating P-type ATPase C-terminal, putative n=1 Tax=Angomonas deanei TaxID=59799 RepID=A0A7G2C546_9TRYP|nr:phospholipid-translocating ATPase [Angomonas deanei]CAD2214938.1 Cation transport ATPase (P-type)/Phospholipid-translocating P-type ATPase C-terminal, putative [Angomonas deanei]|eukprot:EPY36069.1 phospholipid-translocating ATPase [Angomonas deanei]
METKVNLARSPPLSKSAAIDETYNKVAIAIFVLQIFLVLLFSVLTNCTDKHNVWYLGLNKKRLPLMETAVVLPLRFFSMLSPMVPLSFKVMVELSKSYISRVISWDESIQHEGEPALVNNSSLAENLGQVEILVTDKTGTLTSNVMRFKALSTSKGQVFEVDSGDMPVVAKLTSTEANTYHLLLGMTFCNMMKRADAAQNGNHSLSHEASDKWISTSPDEMALTDGAGLCGVVLETRTKTAVKCQFIKEPVTMNIAHVLQFTSERGRMSVLLLDETSKEYLLLTKGSDDSVLPLCLDEKLERSVWSNCVRVFSNRGLRTLVFGYRRVSHTEATDFLRGVNDPNADEDQKKCCCDVLESRLIYCGCTAVKDELQDGVPETVDSLRLANIKLWMITGDKMETAMQTGIASRILRNSDSVLNLIPPDTASLTVEDHLYYVAQRLQEHRNNHLVEAPVPPFWRRMIIKSGLLDFAKEFLLKPNPEILKPVSHQLKRLPDRDHRSILSERHTNQLHRLTSIDSYTDSGNVCVIFSGRTLALIEHSGSAPLMENFQKVLCASGSVICSRTSPNQKAKIVDIAKLSKKVTLAIGDGGNDVAMIQKAHVGVGIKGKEGNQASAASDFSLCQFRFLSTLLFVHGHSAFHRTAMIVQQSFWKTVLIAWVQVLFNFHTVYSGVSFWDSFSLMLYNAIPTVPVTFLCVMDIPLSAWMLLNNPRLYRMSQSGRYLTAATFYGYVLRAILHGTVIFYLAAAFHSGGNEVQLEGHTLDRNGDFYAAYFAIVTIHTYTVLTESHAINFAQWTCFAFSVVSCFWCFAASAQSTLGNQTFLVLLKNPKFYLEYIALLGLIALSLALYATVKASWFPNLLQYQRAVVLRIHRYCRPSSLLSILFADDNPSAFLRSLSPLHLLLPIR